MNGRVLNTLNITPSSLSPAIVSKRLSRIEA